MAGNLIRVYKDDDYATVQDLFKSGVEEQTQALYEYALKLPRTKVIVLGIPLFLYIAFKCGLLSASSATIMLALFWFGAKYAIIYFVQHILKRDALDIKRGYMPEKGACFWVAECSGNVVGMVAAKPYLDPGVGTKVELKHMYVKKEYRGQGFGKALCRNFLKFAKREGYQSAVLEISMVQYGAQRLYELMGFTMCSCFVPPSILGQLLHSIVLSYRYDIPDCSL